MRRRTTIGAMLTAGVVAVTAGVIVLGAAPAGAAVGGSGSSARPPPLAHELLAAGMQTREGERNLEAFLARL